MILGQVLLVCSDLQISKSLWHKTQELAPTRLCSSLLVSFIELDFKFFESTDDAFNPFWTFFPELANMTFSYVEQLID